MCGITGIVGKEDGASRAEHVRHMTRRLAHRGPDAFGIYHDERAALGHARLSIIDLATGTQPIHNERRSLWVVFNGEIFNYIELHAELEARGHVFYTHSDTEVIVHAYEEWGPACLQRFNGQFAIALWDRPRRELFLARDRVGIRPLYYMHTPGGLFFASELKAFMDAPGVTFRLDPCALVQAATMWAPRAPRSAFAGIAELEPGMHALYRADTGALTTQVFWRPPFAAADALDRRPLPVVREELRALLLDACRLRLRADVPVGAYLSGGLDSSVIATIIKRFTDTPLRTFSVSFADKVFDESDHQRAVVAHLGTDHQETLITNAAIARDYERVVWFAEKPLIRTAPAPLMQLSRLVRSEQFKVVLTGEGADEILGGYNIFKEALVRAFWARRPASALRPLLLTRLYPYLEERRDAAHNARWKMFFSRGLSETALPCYSHLVRWRNTARLVQLLAPDVRAATRGYDPIEEFAGQLPDGFGAWPLLHKAQYIEMQTFLSPYLLSSQGDRMAMAHSVEGRFPFLDHRVVEFCGRLSPERKLFGLNEKHLLKRAFEADLPAQVIRRGKQPYRAPIGRSFLCDDPPPFVAELLAPSALAEAGWLDPERVALLHARCVRAGGTVSETDNMALAFALSVQLLWRQFTLKRHPEPTVTPACAEFTEFTPEEPRAVCR